MNEAKFSSWLMSNWLSGRETFAQRIETTTGSGIPDIYMVNQGVVCWLETKVFTPSNHVLVRPFQRAWAYRHAVAGGSSFIVAYNNAWHSVAIWRTHIAMFEVYGKYLKITSPPICVLPLSISSKQNFLDIITRESKQ